MTVELEVKVIDSLTGEILADALQLIKRPFRKEMYMILYLKQREWLSKKKLHGETLRILIFLEGKMGYQNVIPSKKRIMLELDLKPGAISRAFKELRTYGVLVQDGDSLILSPMFYWRGTLKQREEMLKRVTDKAMTDIIKGD